MQCNLLRDFYFSERSMYRYMNTNIAAHSFKIKLVCQKILQ